MVDAAQLEVLQGKLYRWVGLQGHSLPQAVQVHAGYHGLLLVVGGFLVDDAGHGAYLVGCQSCGLGLLLSLAVPESVVLFYHTLHEVVERHIPVHFVGVRHEKGGYGAGVVAPALAVNLVNQGGGYLYRVHHELVRKGSGQFLHGARLGNGEHQRLLLSVLHLPHNGQHALAGFYGVASRSWLFGIAGVANQCAEARQPVL